MNFKTINILDSKKKAILISCVLLVFGFFLFAIIKKTFATEDAGYLYNQTVENLNFNNASLNYENSISTFSVEVENTLNEIYNLSSIDVVFKDEQNNVIESLNGYLGDSLESMETKILEVSVDKEISNVNSIEYRINK